MTQLTTPPNETYAVIVPKDEPDLEVFLHSYLADQLIFDYFTILGTVTSESIDFDVSGIVESRLQYGKYRAYKFYEKDKQAGFTYDKADSFRSLLKSKGVEIGENEKIVIIQKR